MKTGKPVPRQMLTANKATKICASTKPRRGLKRLNARASKELPSAPAENTQPVSLSVSSRTPFKKLGVSGWAIYMAKTANPNTIRKLVKRIFFHKLGGGDSGSCVCFVWFLVKKKKKTGGT